MLTDSGTAVMSVFAKSRSLALCAAATVVVAATLAAGTAAGPKEQAGSQKAATPPRVDLANYPLEIIQPRPGLDTKNRFYKAYPGMEYNVRVAVIGGVYPFRHELTTSPEGMEINGVRGEIVWPKPVEGREPQAVSVKVTDAAGATAQVSWTVTVTEEGFRFLDAEKGKTVADGGTGTLENPWKTLGDMYEGNDYASKTKRSYVGNFLYFRNGTYRVGDAHLESLGKDGTGRMSLTCKPLVWMAYPGESPVLDLSAGYILCMADNVYFDGFMIVNMTNWARKGLSLAPSNNVTVRRNTFRNLTPSGGARNQSCIMISDSHGAFGKYYSFQDNVFEDIKGGVRHHLVYHRQGSYREQRAP